MARHGRANTPISDIQARSGWDCLVHAFDPDLATLFLDFDGTLVDIAGTPDSIWVPDDLCQLLNNVRARLQGRVAIVSGRSISDLRSYLGAFEGPVYGDHGGQLSWDGETEEIASVPAETAKLQEAAVAFCKVRTGLLYEEKPLGFTIHYRGAEALKSDVERFVDEQVGANDLFRKQRAKMAAEVTSAAAGKDRALCDAFGRFGWTGSMPWMIGDDTTDEVAFAQAAALGGAGIKVGNGDTLAPFGIDTPAQVRAFLRNLGVRHG